jgi:hypothetical protein
VFILCAHMCMYARMCMCAPCSCVCRCLCLAHVKARLWLGSPRGEDRPVGSIALTIWEKLAGAPCSRQSGGSPMSTRTISLLGWVRLLCADFLPRTFQGSGSRNSSLSSSLPLTACNEALSGRFVRMDKVRPGGDL